MRITNNIISNNYLNSFNKALERQSSIQEKLADGKAIHRPSDDPIKVMRSLRFNSNLQINEQFAQNVKDATSWMETSDGAMSDLSSIMQRAQELVVSADGTKPADALLAISKELDSLIDHAVDLGNTKLGDRYVFAGQMDKTQPFERKVINNIEVVVYHGDTNKISMPMQPGSANPSQDSVNLTGPEVFGALNDKLGQPPSVDVLNRLIEIKNELAKVGTGATIRQSNANSGAGVVGGTYTGTGYQNFDVKINSVNAGQVTGASYSLDGGHNWIDAGAPTVAAGTATFTLASGVEFTINDAAGNTNNDVYSFRVPPAGSAAVSGPDVQWVSNVGLAYLDSDINMQLRSHTELGARMSSYTMAQNLLENQNFTITNDLANNEDLDVPKAIIDFKNSESVYQAALSIGSKIMPTSLVDFLK